MEKNDLSRELFLALYGLSIYVYVMVVLDLDIVMF